MEPILIAKVVGTLGYMIFEFWLGKTDKVKAGSTVELAVNVIKALKPTITKTEVKK
jgi:hypothetical protein